MSYDFKYLDSNPLSDLSVGEVNNMCQKLHEFSRIIVSQLGTKEESENSMFQDANFWYEMTVQLSRMNRYLIKLVIQPKCGKEHFTESKQKDFHLFVQRHMLPFLERHQLLSNIDTIVYQIAYPCGSKPLKTDPYYVLYGTGKVQHATPFSKIPLELSADTFCEINLAMEENQMRHAIEWLQPMLNTNTNTNANANDQKGEKKLRREIIPFVLELFTQFQNSKYQLKRVMSFSPCPRVIADARFHFHKYLKCGFECYYSKNQTLMADAQHDYQTHCQWTVEHENGFVILFSYSTNFKKEKIN
ncbi:hypothetical protein RFI_01353 [Reticulomyxa filosa]|uniref:Uncharacterized protein n=1 Tax=Reticulomyxa filosa TaxID=46433 RepID=X6PAY8_RETFI|nr:hypothetical protein RFI_01353 [Reticulomyxa filosa]|eukprot:ETO35710.1 hypothetical protein RFI_01353 [Reticulomyxa filosa]